MTFMALSLDDQQDIYGVNAQGLKYAPGNSRLVRDSQEGDLGDIRIVSDTPDQYFFHLTKLLSSLL